MGPDSTDVADLEVDRLVLGHYQDVWGVAAESVGAGPRFISCGHDGNVTYLISRISTIYNLNAGNVICWDAIAHTDLWVVQLNGKAQCVAMSPDGLAYAVGDLYLQYLQYIYNISTTYLQYIYDISTPPRWARWAGCCTWARWRPRST